MAVGRATGKIILMGEHAVVYGEPAIAMPFSAVEIVSTVEEEGEALSVSCDFYRGLVHEMPKVWEGLKHAIRFSLYRIGAPSDPAIHITISSTIPAERGMGSSAAVAVAVARSLFAFYGKVLTDQELWEIVQSSETIAHGNPSGVDAATTSGKDPVFFRKNAPIEALSIDLNAYLVVGDTGKIGHTLEAVDDVAILYQRNCEVRDWIGAIGQLTRQARADLEKGDRHSLGQKMSQVHSYLQKLGVSTKDLDDLVQVALDHGALGAKLTGGGRGGCMIALAPTREAGQLISQALLEQGAQQTWIQYLGE